MRDRLFDGVVSIAIGLVPLALAAALVSTPVGDSSKGTFVLVVAGIGLAFATLGAFWVSRRVTFAPNGVTLATWLGRRTIATENVASVRLRLEALGTQRKSVSGAVLVVVGRNRESIAVSLRSRDTLDVACAWLPQACGAVMTRWQAELAQGETLSFGRQARLHSHVLEKRGLQIDLDQNFTLKELPGGPSSSPTLRVEGSTGTIEIDGGVDNYYVLAHFLRAAQQRTAITQNPS